jgi:hypothetical protein
MSRYYQPLNNALNSNDFLKSPVTWFVGGIIIISIIVGVLLSMGFFSSSRARDDRLYYAITNNNVVSDDRRLNKIRANEFSSLDSQNDPIVSSGNLWASGGVRRRRPTYPLNSIPENPITTSSTLLPQVAPLPIVNPMPSVDTQATMMPQLPELSGRYTNQNFGSTQDLSNPVMNSRIGVAPLNTPTYTGGLERRTAKRTAY